VNSELGLASKLLNNLQVLDYSINDLNFSFSASLAGSNNHTEASSLSPK
jgi:hypothetical protein